MLTGNVNGEIPGLRDVNADERPPVAVVFWSFRIMVGIGIAMIFTGILAIIMYFRGVLFTNKPLHIWCILMAPSGFIAVLAGWFVTEVGRQPYTVYGLLRTVDSISPVIAEQILISLCLFILVYMLIFVAGTYYIIKLIAKGPTAIGEMKTFYHNKKI